MAAAEQKADPGAEPWQGQPRSPPLKFGGGSRAGGRGARGSRTQAVLDAPSPKAKPWSRAAFVQPLQKALTPPLRSLFAATRARRGNPSWSSPCRSEQPSSAAFCRVRACAGGLGSPLPDFARALGVTPAPAAALQGCPKAGVGRFCWPNPAWGGLAGWGGAVSHPAAPWHCPKMCWGSSKGTEPARGWSGG